jgi:hypothetical protein
MFVQLLFNTVEFGRRSVLVILQVDRSLNLLCFTDSVDNSLEYTELLLLLGLEPSVLCYNLGRVSSYLRDVFLHRVRQFKSLTELRVAAVYTLRNDQRLCNYRIHFLLILLELVYT